MTPSQQTALETLTGRAMTAAEVTMATARQDATLATSLSAGRTVQGSITTGTFAGWCAQTGLRGIVEDTANKPTATFYATALRHSALAILDILHGAAASLDLSASAQGQANVQMLGAWVTAGAITAAQEAQLVSLAAQPAPIATASVSAILNGA